MQLLVSGAIQGEDGHQGVTAVLLIVEAPGGRILHRAEYNPPAELVAEGQKIQFTGSCFIDGVYYVCSHNEILVFEDWPPTEPTRRITVEGLNDLHNCCEWQGGLAISNTGLETIDHVSTDGELLNRWDMLTDADEERVHPLDKDIRLLADTKPHLRHANHVFAWDGELWTGQLSTWDTVCVTDPSKRLKMDVGMPHDGTVVDGQAVFSTTNGHLVTFDGKDEASRTAHNLVQMTPDLEQLGWCRGLQKVPGTESEWFVMFSALRRSKWKETAYFIKYRHKMPKSHIARYDLAKAELVEKWPVGEGVGYQLFQVDALPEDRWV